MPGFGVEATDVQLEAENVAMKSSKHFLKNFEGFKHKDVAPPGWEGTVTKMKTKGKVENPYALSWWMYGQGYSPS
jgi:hypothetical protein